MLIGCVFGSVTGGLQSYYLGRKWSLIIDNILFFFGNLMISTAPSYHFILIGRFITGCACTSAGAVTAVYGSEVCQPRIRALAASMNMAGYFSGGGANALIGALVHWRIAIAINAAIWRTIARALPNVSTHSSLDLAAAIEWEGNSLRRVER